jgi:hypothetical protein
MDPQIDEDASRKAFGAPYGWAGTFRRGVQPERRSNYFHFGLGADRNYELWHQRRARCCRERPVPDSALWRWGHYRLCRLDAARGGVIFLWQPKGVRLMTEKMNLYRAISVAQGFGAGAHATMSEQIEAWHF